LRRSRCRPARLPASLSRDDQHGALGHIKRLGQYLDQLGVGGAINRSGVEPNEQRTTSHAGNT